MAHRQTASGRRPQRSGCKAMATRVFCIAVVLCFVPVCQPGATAGRWGGIRGGDKTNFLRLRGGQKSGGAGNTDKKDIQMPMLNSMLRISTALTNVTSEEHVARTPMDPERIAFLRNAMAEMLENTTDVFVMSVENLQLDESSDENMTLRLVALENINERVDHMDLAVGLRNMGGFPHVINCLASANSSVRWKAADVLATSVQNHDELQRDLVGMGALAKVTELYANRSEDGMVRLKSLNAASALVRGNQTSEMWFLYNQGLGSLRADIQIGEVRMRRKALFVLTHLLRSNPVLKAAVLQIEEGPATQGKGVLPELVQSLNCSDLQVSEFAVGALLVLLEDAAREHLEVVRTQFPHLRTTLQTRLEEQTAGLDSSPAEGEEAVVPAEVEETRRLLALVSHGRRSEPTQRRPQGSRGSPGHRSRGRRSAR